MEFQAVKEAQGQDMFIEHLNWGEDGLEFGWFYKDEQTETVSQGRSTIVLVESEEVAEAYRQLQELSQWVLEDALQRMNEEKNSR